MTMLNLLVTAVAALGQWLWVTVLANIGSISSTLDGSDSMTAILTTCAVGALSVISIYSTVNAMLSRLTGGLVGNTRNNNIINGSGSGIITAWPSWLLWVVFVGGLFMLYHHFCLFLIFAMIWAILHHGLDYTPTQDATGVVIVVATLFLAWLLRRSLHVLGIGKFVQTSVDAMLLYFWHAFYTMGRFVLVTIPKTLVETVWLSLLFVVGMLMLPFSVAHRLDDASDDDDDDENYEYESESDEPFDQDDYEAEDFSLLLSHKKKKTTTTVDHPHDHDEKDHTGTGDNFDDSHQSGGGDDNSDHHHTRSSTIIISQDNNNNNNNEHHEPNTTTQHFSSISFL